MELVCPLRVKEGEEGKEARLKMDWGWWASGGQRAQSGPVESGKVDWKERPQDLGRKALLHCEVTPRGNGSPGENVLSGSVMQRWSSRSLLA